MQLLNFLIITIIFSFVGNGILRIFFAMIAPNGALDVMFGWQKKLDRWYAKGNSSKFYRWLHDALGGCPMCTSFWFAPVWFTVYVLFCLLVLKWFVTDYVDGTAAKIFVAWVWAVVMWVGNALLGLIVLKFRK